jgi:hypothetical protein
MKGFSVHENALGFQAVRLHYSAMPEHDVTHPDPEIAAQAQAWLAEAKRTFADPARFQQEMEINWWVSIGARVYPEFQESHHAPFALAPNPRKVLYRAWDFGWHAPACLIASIDGKDRLLTLKEVVGKEQTTRDFAQYVLRRCAEWYGPWAPGYQDFCDPAGQQVKSMASEKQEKRDVEVLDSLGIHPKWEYGWSRKDGRALVHQLLVLRTDGSPGILVDPTGCPTLVQGFLGKYVYPERQDGRVKDEPEEDNHPWSDVHAALRYLATGLYSALGLRRFAYQPILKKDAPAYTGYGTPKAKGKRNV